MIPDPWSPKQINHPGTISHAIDGVTGHTPDMLRVRAPWPAPKGKDRVRYPRIAVQSFPKEPRHG
jgi:hypothetical protein